MRDVATKALHSELFAELSGRFSRRNEYSRDGTSSEKARKTRSDPNFRYLGISETRENENFGKKPFSKLEITEIFEKFGKKFGKSSKNSFRP